MKLEYLDKLTNLETLTLTLIGEARGEPIEGQVAVGCVIRNRSEQWKRSIKEICLQPRQFSCWNIDDPNRALLVELAEKMVMGTGLNSIVYAQCQYVALGIVNHEILDNTHGALNYLTTSLFASDAKPDWAKNVSSAVVKGKQTFLKV